MPCQSSSGHRDKVSTGRGSTRYPKVHSQGNGEGFKKKNGCSIMNRECRVIRYESVLSCMRYTGH
jgi:hypothetical protein